MKDKNQNIFTRIDVQGTPVESEILSTLEDVGMTEELLRQYIQEALSFQSSVENIGHNASRSLLTPLPLPSSFSSHIFEESYVKGVLGIQIPLNESHPYSAELQTRIIEEQLVLEGWFDGFKKLGGDMKNFALALRYMFEDPSRIKEFVATSFNTIIKEPLTKIVEFIKKIVAAIAGWFEKFELGKKIKAIWEKTKAFLLSLQEKLEGAWSKIQGLAGWKQALGVIAFGVAIGYLWQEKGWGEIVEKIAKRVDAATEVVNKWGTKLAKTMSQGAISLVKKVKSESYVVPSMGAILYEEDEKLHEFLGGIFGKGNEEAAEMGLELSKGTPSPSDGILISPEQAKKAGVEGKSEEEANDELENAKDEIKDELSDELKSVAEELGGTEEVQAMKEEIIEIVKPIFGEFQEVFVDAASGLLKRVGIEAVSALVTGGIGSFLSGIKSAYGGLTLVSDLFGDTLGSFIQKIEDPEAEAKEADAGQDDPTDSSGGKKKEQASEALVRQYIRNKLLISGHA